MPDCGEDFSAESSSSLTASGMPSQAAHPQQNKHQPRLQAIHQVTTHTRILYLMKNQNAMQNVRRMIVRTAKKLQVVTEK